MRIGVTSYSFAQAEGAGLAIYDLPARAKELGFEGLELANILQADKDVDLARLKAAMEQARMPACGYCTSADFARDVKEQSALVRAEIDRAAFLGAPVVRTDIYQESPPDPYRAEVVEAIRLLAEYAAAKGVALTTENHGGYFCTSDRLALLCRKVGHGNFGILADTGNFQDTWEDPAAAVANLAGLIRHVHLKDCHIKSGDGFYPGEEWYVTRTGDYLRGAIVGHGSAPLCRCLNILRQAGYDGWLIVEFEGMEDVFRALAMSLRNIRRMLSQLAAGTRQPDE